MMSLARVAKLKTWLAFAAGALVVACSLVTNFDGISDGEPAADAMAETGDSGGPEDDAPNDATAPYDGRVVKCGTTGCALDRGEVCCIATSLRVTLGTACAPVGQCPDSLATPEAGWEASIAVTEIACDETDDCDPGTVCCHKCGLPCGSGHRGIGQCAQPSACLGAYDQIACNPKLADAACPKTTVWTGRCTLDDDPVRSGVCVKN